MKNMQTQLIELLNIYAPSSKEKPVRDYLKPILTELMDSVYVDNYGNLLGIKTVGTGEGAVVMLSAHMDTVRGVQPNKIVVEEKGVIVAKLPNGTRTVLGADDRAGIAIILSVLRNIPTTFNGTIKVAFSREEEIGCIGADKIKTTFYADVDLAIVVDRRDSRDIVVGCDMAFCTNAVGTFMEEMSAIADMDYECVEGGISDAVTFSNNYINSINLSAGYMNEHTSNEYVVLAHMKDTAKLIVQTFALINGFYEFFGELKSSNKWVKPHKYSKYNYSYDVDETMWVETYDDNNGDIFAYGHDGNIILQQGGNEIIIDPNQLDDLYDKIKESITLGIK